MKNNMLHADWTKIRSRSIDKIEIKGYDLTTMLLVKKNLDGFKSGFAE